MLEIAKDRVNIAYLSIVLLNKPEIESLLGVFNRERDEVSLVLGVDGRAYVCS